MAVSQRFSKEAKQCHTHLTSVYCTTLEKCRTYYLPDGKYYMQRN